MSKDVTDRQGVEHARLARSKGIARDIYQTSHDDGTMSRVLDAIKGGLPINIGFPIVPPSGGRIYTVKVKIQLDRPWQEAVNAAGSDTPDSYNVRKVGDLYLPTDTGVVEEEIILLNYPNGDGSWEKALAWAEQFQLKKTDPRRVFAIGECHPNFHHDVGVDPTYVVATEDCPFGGRRRACGVWWDGSGRGADLDWVGGYGGANDWFAFRK